MQANDELRQKVREALRALTPSGSRLCVTSGELLEVEVVCDGENPLMTYKCGFDPGHSGRCHSFNKGVDFTPVVGGAKGSHFLIVSGYEDIGPIGCMDSPSGEDFIHAEKEDPGVTFEAVSPDACPVCNYE